MPIHFITALLLLCSVSLAAKSRSQGLNAKPPAPISQVQWSLIKVGADIKNLKWNEMGGKVPPKSKVVLRGNFKRDKWGLFVGQRLLKIDPKGNFKLTIKEIQESQFDLMAVGPKGEIEKMAIRIALAKPEPPKPPTPDLAKNEPPPRNPLSEMPAPEAQSVVEEKPVKKKPATPFLGMAGAALGFYTFSLEDTINASTATLVSSLSPRIVGLIAYPITPTIRVVLNTNVRYISFQVPPTRAFIGDSLFLWGVGLGLQMVADRRIGLSFELGTGLQTVPFVTATSVSTLTANAVNVPRTSFSASATPFKIGKYGFTTRLGATYLLSGTAGNTTIENGIGVEGGMGLSYRYHDDLRLIGMLGASWESLSATTTKQSAFQLHASIAASFRI